MDLADTAKRGQQIMPSIFRNPIKCILKGILGVGQIFQR